MSDGFTTLLLTGLAADLHSASIGTWNTSGVYTTAQTGIVLSTHAAAGGTLVKIVGTGFFLAGVSDVVATGVKLAAHAFPSYSVDSNQVIWGITPAEDAGTTNITVTNSIGASNGLPFVTTA